MPPTVQAVIDLILREIAVAPLADTVDTLKAGDPAQPVTGIMTSFMATMEVLRQAVAAGANFVITHEPTFYNHRDEVEWLKDDPVYLAKRQYLETNHLAVWRFHDYWHRYAKDGIQTGVVQQLGWEAYQAASSPYEFDLPPQSLAALVQHVQTRLGARHLRVLGPAEMICRKVVLGPGSPPTEMQLAAVRAAEVVITGETSEWQVVEYTRDAQALGQAKALILVGHERSEEAGMAYLADWLAPRLPSVPVTHVPSGEPALGSIFGVAE